MNPHQNEVKLLADISERMKAEQLTRQQLVTSKTNIKVTDDEVDSVPRLIYNHALTKTDLRSLSGLGQKHFVQSLENAQNAGVIGDPIYNNITHLYTRHHVEALLNFWEKPTYRDTYKPRVVGIENQKGGIGKSTTTLMLATASALDLSPSSYAKVLVLEVDPQATNGRGMINSELVDDETIFVTLIDLILGPFETSGIYQDLIAQGLSDEDIIRQSAMSTHLPNLFVQPAFSNDGRFTRVFFEADKATQQKIISRMSQTIIPALKKDYDLIYIDTPPQDSPLVWVVNDAVEFLIIPVTPKAFDFDSTVEYASSTAERFKQLPSQGKNLLWFRFLITNHDSNSQTEMGIKNKLTRTARDRLMSLACPRSEVVAHAADIGRSIFDVSKKEVKDKKICSAKKYDEVIFAMRAVYEQIIGEIRSLSVKDAE